MGDKLGRKFFLVFSMVAAGSAAFLIWAISSSVGNLILSCLFGGVSTMGFNALDCLGAELDQINCDGHYTGSSKTRCYVRRPDVRPSFRRFLRCSNSPSRITSCWWWSPRIAATQHDKRTFSLVQLFHPN